MADLIPKTYTLSPHLVDQIEEIVGQAAENDLKVSSSFVVRLGLAQGLPLVTEKLGLEGDLSIERSDFAIV